MGISLFFFVHKTLLPSRPLHDDDDAGKKRKGKERKAALRASSSSSSSSLSLSLFVCVQSRALCSSTTNARSQKEVKK